MKYMQCCIAVSVSHPARSRVFPHPAHMVSLVSHVTTHHMLTSVHMGRQAAVRLIGWHRVKAGEWLGPWVLCHTLEAVMKKMEPGSLHVHVHVVSQPGGAVPVLYTARYAYVILVSGGLTVLCDCKSECVLCLTATAVYGGLVRC